MTFIFPFRAHRLSADHRCPQEDAATVGRALNTPILDVQIKYTAQNETEIVRKFGDKM
jgi:hypothetical protein